MKSKKNINFPEKDKKINGQPKCTLTSNLMSNKVIFQFNDNDTYIVDVNTILEVSPGYWNILLTSKQKDGDIKIEMPKWMTVTNLKEYIYTYKNGVSATERSNEFLLNILKTSEVFQNDIFSAQIIQDEILLNLNKENSFDLMEFSYEKLKYCSDNGISTDPIWFELFYKSLEYTGNNFSYYIESETRKERIKQLNSNVIEELLEKAFSDLLFNHFFLNNSENDCSNSAENYFESNRNIPFVQNNNTISLAALTQIIRFLSEIRGTKHFFETIAREYLSIISDENISELNNTPIPVFQVKIPIDFEKYYSEFPYDFRISNKQLLFTIFYRKSEDSLNVCVKLNEIESKKNQFRVEDDFCYKIFTFLTIVRINDDASTEQINAISITTNKSMCQIFKISNFKSILGNILKNTLTNKNSNSLCHTNTWKKENTTSFENMKSYPMAKTFDKTNAIQDYFTVKIYLKLCVIHSILASYFLLNFYNLYNCPEINKISKQLLILIIQSKNLAKQNEDQVVKALITWMNDEYNITVEIDEIIESVKWEDVSLNLFLEFMMKYGKMIHSKEIEKIFFNALEKKLMNQKKSEEFCSCIPFVRNLFQEIVNTAKQVNYCELYKENQKIKKLYEFNRKRNENIKDFNLSGNTKIELENSSLHALLNKSIHSKEIAQSPINENASVIKSNFGQYLLSSKPVNITKKDTGAAKMVRNKSSIAPRNNCCNELNNESFAINVENSFCQVNGSIRRDEPNNIHQAADTIKSVQVHKTTNPLKLKRIVNASDKPEKRVSECSTKKISPSRFKNRKLPEKLIKKK